ncbi:hypothetical protein Ahy_A02g007784 isoform C [Arachis hypogaea]|uniref:PB1-like domain-containing protein n=1 Tax=Arachis hypogaea TaxID=3818 RepID=A0A445ED60_ARAHY|nr:hypothetical protein Ahy_A02g007784 isoform C [Arachis hypogaea]
MWDSCNIRPCVKCLLFLSPLFLFPGFICHGYRVGLAVPIFTAICQRFSPSAPCELMSVFVIPVFNHGRKLVRANGKLHYLDRKVEKFPPIDIDFLNKKDLEELFKGLGYLTYKQIYWHDPTVIEFEDGLHVLYGDKEINDMCDFTMSNNLKEFHLYFEHGVDIPVVTYDEPVVEKVIFEDDDVVSKSSSSSYDSYESAEDEAYKPPPPGYETESSEEHVDVQRKKKKNWKYGSPKTMAKRRASRRYTGKRRRKHVLNREIESGPSSGDSGLGQGPGSGGYVGPDRGNMEGPDSDKIKKHKKKPPKRPHASQEEILITQSAPPVPSQGEPATPGQPTSSQPGQPT